MSFLFFLLATLFWIFPESRLWAQSPSEPSSLISFIENRGQWVEDLKFTTKLGEGKVFFEEDRFIYHLQSGSSSHKENKSHIHHHHHGNSHAVFVDLLGANEGVVPMPSNLRNTYHNYFLGNNPSRWAGRVPLWKALTYPSIYPGIDLRFFGEGEHLKYEFYCQKGAIPQHIRLRYQGGDKLEIKEGALHIHTSLGTIVEEAPLAYQLKEGARVEVPCEFQLEGNILSFNFLQGYSPDLPLIIDPVLVFATHTGSLANNFGYTATYDEDGNSYGGGIEIGSAIGSRGYPTHPGAFQDSSSGMDEITLSKFNEDGTRLLWSTYLGGSGDEYPHSMIVNQKDELFFFGYTSSPDFPITSTAFDPLLNGGTDIYVARLSSGGDSLLASTYVGGSGRDGINIGQLVRDSTGDLSRGEIILSQDGGILIGSVSASTDFPTTFDAFQRLPGTGGADGILFELSPDCSTLEWATHVGGTGLDAIYGLKQLANGNIVATGGTNSQDLPLGGPAYQVNFQGGNLDGFVVNVSGNGDSLIASSYLGTGASDQAYLLDVGPFGDIFITGQTTSSSWPIRASGMGAFYSDPGAKQFIVKMPENLRGLDWSTTFGNPAPSSLALSPTAFMVDDCGRIYFSGWGETLNWPITANALQSQTDNEDFYLAVFEENMRGLEFGTYFGGNGAFEHVDGGTSRFDRRGVIHQAICSSCLGSRSFPGTPGSLSPSSASTLCNLAMVKIDLETFAIKADFELIDSLGQALPSSACVPFEVNFKNLSTSTGGRGGFTYQWDFGLAGTSSTALEPRFTFDTPGTYTVSLIVGDSLGCREGDTAFRQVVVHALPYIEAQQDTLICPGQRTTIRTGGSQGSYDWSPSTVILSQDSSGKSIDIALEVEEKFEVVLTDSNGCKSVDSLRVSISQTGPIVFLGDSFACFEQDISLRAKADWGQSYRWSGGNVDFTEPDSLSTLVLDLKESSLVELEVRNELGCMESAQLLLQVEGSQQQLDTALCEGSALELNLPLGLSYEWEGFSINTQSLDLLVGENQIIQGSSETPNGCRDERSWNIRALQLPGVDAGPDTSICLGDSLKLMGNGGGKPNWVFDMFLENNESFSPLVYPEDTRSFYLRLTDSLGCANLDSMEVKVLPPPLIKASEDQYFCKGDSLLLEGEGGETYRWIPPMYLSDPGTARPWFTGADSSITYVLEGRDQEGCLGLDTFSLNFQPAPNTLVEKEVDCEKGDYLLIASGGQSYEWSTGENEAEIRVSPPFRETYSVAAIKNGCSGNLVFIELGSDSILPTANFNLDVEEGYAPFEVQAINLSQNAQSFIWLNPFTGPKTQVNPTFSIPDPGSSEITLIAESSQGCRDSLTRVLRSLEVLLKIPNAFSPNGDQVNDAFFLLTEGIQELEVQIFNRWGLLIYEDRGVDFEWRGQGPEGPVSEGVYVYKVQARGFNGRNYEQVGTLTLVR